MHRAPASAMSCTAHIKYVANTRSLQDVVVDAVVVNSSVLYMSTCIVVPQIYCAASNGGMPHSSKSSGTCAVAYTESAE